MDIEKGLEQWKRPEELMKLAAQREENKECLSSDELLMLKSRSFYGPILFLELLKGPEESSKRAEIRNLYNQLRELDTIEDNTSLSVNEKCELIDRFTYVVAESARINGSNSKSVEDIIRGDELRTVTAALERSISKKNDEKIFTRHFGFGPVIRELYSFDQDTKSDIDYAVGRMATGMKNFLKRGEMQTKEQLKEYCFYVAGSIGGFLKRLVKKRDNVDLNENKGERFGEFLQLVNIIKNTREDYNEGRIFLPRELRPNDMSYMTLMNDSGESAKTARESMFENTINMAESNWNDVISYIQSIPASISGYKSFTLISLIAARESIETMRRAGAEEVFAGKETAIKYQGGILPIMKFSAGIVSVSSSSRTNDWLSAYQKDYRKMPFSPQNHQEWSRNWLVP